MPATRYPFELISEIPDLPIKDLVVRCDFDGGLSPAAAEHFEAIVQRWIEQVRAGVFGDEPHPDPEAPRNLWHAAVHQAGPITMECELYRLSCRTEAIPALLTELSQISTLTRVELE